jgi:NCAIR mutase (PurE)-related protein
VLKIIKVAVEEALGKLEDLPFKDLGFAKIDNHREVRVGYPEVIYCEGKTVDQVKDIVKFMLAKNNNILGTRANEVMYTAVK